MIGSPATNEVRQSNDLKKKFKNYTLVNRGHPPHPLFLHVKHPSLHSLPCQALSPHRKAYNMYQNLVCITLPYILY